MRLGLFVNTDRDHGLAVSRQILEYLRDRGVELVADPSSHPEAVFDLEGLRADTYAGCEAILTLGGDGTLLSAAHCEAARGIPLVGINLGSLGFMTEIDPACLPSTLDALLAGKYRLDQRMQLFVRAYRATGEQVFEGFAVNDAVVSRAPFSRIVTYRLYLDAEPVEILPGDGMILSTPTGSTGYAMAAGGPILDPHLQALQITPLCPHTLDNRAYLIEPNTVVRVEVYSKDGLAYLAVDGRDTLKLNAGDAVEVSRHREPLRLLTFESGSFYTKVPEKIHLRSRYTGQTYGTRPAICPCETDHTKQGKEARP